MIPLGASLSNQGVTINQVPDAVTKVRVEGGYGSMIDSVICHIQLDFDGIESM